MNGKGRINVIGGRLRLFWGWLGWLLRPCPGHKVRLKWWRKSFASSCRELLEVGGRRSSIVLQTAPFLWKKGYTGQLG